MTRNIEVLSNETILAHTIYISSYLKQMKEEVFCVYNDENIPLNEKVLFILSYFIKICEIKNEIDHLRSFFF